MLFSSISCRILLLTGSIIYSYGAKEKESISSSTALPDYGNSNEDYTDNYDDYQDRDYPNPDYYGSPGDREGRDRSLPDDGHASHDHMSEEHFLRQLQTTIPGIPGVDYPLYQSVPDTSFQCQNQRNPGFYGDVEARCQVFHICQEDDRHDSFLCPVGTVFNQMNFICDWWFNFKCADTPTFFHLNAQFDTSTGSTLRSTMMRETMNKMRRFRETTKDKLPDMEISMRAMISNLDSGSKRMYMDNQKRMAEMERRRIMNLFSPKMRPRNFWKRLRVTASQNEKLNNDMLRVSSTSATAPVRNEDFKSLASTDHLDFTNAEDSTTSLTTTGATVKSSPSIPNFETTSESVNGTIFQNCTEDALLRESTPNTFQSFDEINTKSIELATSSMLKTSLSDNSINIMLTVPTTTTFDAHSVSESGFMDNQQNDALSNENSYNDIQSRNDLGLGNDTRILSLLAEAKLGNPTNPATNDVSETDDQMNDDPVKSVATAITPWNPQLTLRLNAGSGNSSTAARRNGSHISVYVTIRATPGISRLKWRRIPRGKKRKSLQLKNVPGDTNITEHPNYFMDPSFKKRPLRNKKLRSRIMWIPTKNNTLSRKSHWRIFLNSRPQNSRTGKRRDEIQKAELSKGVISPIMVRTKELDKSNNFELNNIQADKVSMPPDSDSTDETLITESTKLTFTLMAASEPTTLNASVMPAFNTSMTVHSLNGSENQSLESHENLMDSEGNLNCEAICIKLLRSLGVESLNGDANMTSTTQSDLNPTTTDYISHSDTIEEKQFGRRSFLGVSPSDQWTVKYDPGPNCDEDKDNDKVLVRGWSVIIDSGSVTKEKTVKRRGCRSIFNDSKIIVMQNLLPDHHITPVEEAPKHGIQGVVSEPKISFGSMDQQYWLTLVKNWLEATPDSKQKPMRGADSTKEWNGDRNQVRNRDGEHSHQGRSFQSNSRWMDAYYSRNGNGPRELRVDENGNQNSRKRHTQASPLNERRKFHDLDDSATNKQVNAMNSKYGRSEGGSRRSEWQVKSKSNPKGRFNQVGAPRKNDRSGAGSKGIGNNDWGHDVPSSQSGSNAWHIDAADRMDDTPEDGRWKNSKSEKRGNRKGWNNAAGSKPSLKTWASSAKGGGNMFRPRSGTPNRPSGQSDRKAFPDSSSNDWSDRQENRMKNAKRYQDEWFMSSEQNKQIYQPQNNKPAWSDVDADDKPDWSYMSSQNQKLSASDKTWSLGIPDSSVNKQSSDNFNSNRKEHWPSEGFSGRNKGSRDNSWSSENGNKNNGFPRASKGSGLSSGSRSFMGDEKKNQFPDANISHDWSSKGSNSQVDWSSNKRGRRDDKAWFDKADEESGRNPQDRFPPSDSKSNKKSPDFTDTRDENVWNKNGQKGDWNSRPGDSQEGWSSISQRDKNTWVSDDQQKKSDWSTNKGVSSRDSDIDRRKKESRSQSDFADGFHLGRKSPPTDNRKRNGNTWPSSSDKSRWTQDTQKDISDWSSDDRQSTQDDWSSKSRENTPSWKKDQEPGINIKPPQSKDSKDAWFDDWTKNEDSWSSDTLAVNRNEWDKTDKQIPSGWSSADRQDRRDYSSSQGKGTFDVQKDISNDDRSFDPKSDWKSETKGGNPRGIPDLNADWSDDSLESKPDWSSGSKRRSNGQGSLKGTAGNQPSSSQGQNTWDRKPNSYPQSQDKDWKTDPPKASPDWFSSRQNSKGTSKTKGQGSKGQSDWSNDDSPPASFNPPNQMEENWSWDADSIPDLITGQRPDSDSPSWSDSRGSEEDWPPSSKKKHSWSSGPMEDRRTVSLGKASVKGQSAAVPKGRTKTAMVMPNTSKGRAGMLPGKPWSDDSNQVKPMKDVKGDFGMKEEKIVWSIQISSNGKPENGWVPITLRPNIKNQTRNQNNGKGMPMKDGGWSGVTQETDSWGSKVLDKITTRPQFKMDMITENSPSSSHMPDASDSHPFYIPIVSGRYKREASQAGSHINSSDSARRIYRVIRNGKELKDFKTSENDRFYLASANILVGDTHTIGKNSTNFGKRKKSKFRVIGKREYNATIKNSVPSLIRIRNLRKHLDIGNFTLDNADQPQNGTSWDSLMQESETKETWSAPFDDSNVPASGWIPLFRVVKVPRNFPTTTTPQLNIAPSEETTLKVIRTNDSDSTVYNDNESSRHQTNHSLASPAEALVNSTMNLTEVELESFPLGNITTHSERPENRQHFDQEMKVGNKTLRIIPFSDIMKQLRMRPTEAGEVESSSERSVSDKDEWNIPITTAPKTYALKLIDGSEMWGHNLSNSWNFAKRPRGSEAWILVKGSEGENKTTSTENRNSTHRNQKSIDKNGIPYRIIVGNRTRQQDELFRPPQKQRTIQNNSQNEPNHQPSKEFSFELKNWHKESGWTPLLRAVGNVTSKKINHSFNKTSNVG